MNITWTNERRRLGDLKPQEDNPRQIDKAQAERLVRSFDQFNQVESLAINPDGLILNGHQRYFVLLAAHDNPDYEVDVRVASRPLTRREWQELTVLLHEGATGEWDFDALAEWDGVDASDLIEWGFSEDELLNSEFSESANTEETQIGREGRLYLGHDIEPYKLAHRVEAAWQAPDGIMLDLFSGFGELAAWYRRRFECVITVDKNTDCEVDYNITASKFIQTHLLEFIDSFSFVDFDDEGTPAREICEFFNCIAGKRTSPFILALTDGNGLNLKFRGKYNPSIYFVDEAIRQATHQDYEDFEDIVTRFVLACTKKFGFSARNLSSYRGRQGNVIYQTWFITTMAVT